MKPPSTPPGQIHLRPAVPADAAAFRELRLEALRLHPQAFSADYESSLAISEAQWSERLQPDQNGVILFAEVDAALVGMSGIRLGGSPKTRHSAMVWGVYVRSRWRGLGLSTTLVSACVCSEII